LNAWFDYVVFCYKVEFEIDRNVFIHLCTLSLFIYLFFVCAYTQNKKYIVQYLPETHVFSCLPEHNGGKLYFPLKIRCWVRTSISVYTQNMGFHSPFIGPPTSYIRTRAANESSSSEPGLAQTWFIKIRVELVKRFELKNLVQVRFITIRASS
jgi:hypothetical protein